jgi:hypothetical protein
VTLPSAVEDAVMRSLAKRAVDRYDNARDMRKVLEQALRDNDLGLVETQKLERSALAELRTLGGAEQRGKPPSASPGISAPRTRADAAQAGGPADRIPNSSAGRRPTAGALADELEPPVARTPRRGKPWLAAGLAVAVLVGGAAVGMLVLRKSSGFRSSVAIAGVALTRGQTVGKLVVETDGTVEPSELARLYTSTLGALRAYVQANQGGGKLEISDPIDVLLAVPPAALCEPTAYLDHQAPQNCASLLSATAIGARGTHRLMVVSDRAQLVSALRKGVAQAACEFSPEKDDKRMRRICDVTSRFAESTN